MNKWTDERVAQLQNLTRCLRELADANSANNFLIRISEASEIAESLLYCSSLDRSSFIQFLTDMAIQDRSPALDDYGPQRQPSSLRKIVAEVRAVTKEMDEIERNE